MIRFGVCVGCVDTLCRTDGSGHFGWPPSEGVGCRRGKGLIDLNGVKGDRRVARSSNHRRGNTSADPKEKRQTGGNIHDR